MLGFHVTEGFEVLGFGVVVGALDGTESITLFLKVRPLDIDKEGVDGCGVGNEVVGVGRDCECTD